MYKTYRTLGLIWSELYKEKLFQIGLLIKAILVIFILPLSQQEWFIPFMVNWIESPFSIPWTKHLSSGGDSLSFPYGIIMFIVHLPSTLIGWILDSLSNLTYFTGAGFRISLLLTDIALLLVLLQI